MIVEVFETRTAASNAAASLVAKAINEALDDHENTSLLVSGGSSPLECLSILSDETLDWRRVTVSLTDERCVPVTDDRSNEKMVREQLLRNRAELASFIHLSCDNVGVLADSLAVSLIGMGEDGHFASLFPDNPSLNELLDVDQAPACFQVTTVASDVHRTTANLPLLLSGNLAVLLVFGEKKRAILESPGSLPVASLINQTEVPLHICWAP